MFVSGEIVGENEDGTVTLRTSEGLDLRIPIDRFVDAIDSDLTELGFVSAQTVRLSLLSRLEEGKLVTKAGPNGLAIILSPTRETDSDSLFSEFLLDSRMVGELFGGQHLVVASGLLPQMDDSVDVLSRAVRLLAGTGGLYLSSPEGEKFNQQTFTLGSLSIGGKKNLIPVLANLLSESQLSRDQVSAFIQAIEGLGSSTYETMGQMLRVDEVEDIRRFFDYSSHLENGRLVHTPRSPELRSRAVKAFCEYMLAGLVDWLDREKSPTHVSTLTVVELPLSSVEFSSFAELVRVYLYDCMFGRTLAALLERPVTGLFDLLEGAATHMNDAETFLTKLHACNPSIKRRGIVSFLLPNGLELRADDLLLALEVARVTSAWSSANPVVDWVLKRPLERANHSLAVTERNKRDRFSIAGWRPAISLLARTRGQGEILTSLVLKAKKIRKIYVLSPPTLTGVEDVVSAVLAGQDHPWSMEMSEAEYWVKYASVGVRGDPETKKNSGEMCFLPEQERAMNKTLISVRSAAMVVIKSVWHTWRSKRWLLVRIQAARRIQRWFRRIRGEVNGEFGLKRNQQLWRRLLEVERSRTLEVKQLEAENRKLLKIIKEKDFLIDQLCRCNAGSVEDAEEGFGDPQMIIQKLELRIRVLEHQNRELSPSRGS